MQRLPGAIFQQDNARLHTARVSQDCLRTVTTLPWNARSPYLTPIEHIWDHLGRRVGNPTSLNELEARVAINSGPKEPKGHVNEKTREVVTTHFMVVINLALVLLDPNSPRAIELWTLHPRSATLHHHCPVHYKHLRYPLSPSEELSCVPVF
ncbi:transposable element Tcb2 transposase [Trichonephila clavipes]|nr:transposable element Tcb2 transposase [Trichonephila clavipes]